MAKKHYFVDSSETVFYTNIVEAENEEEAKKIIMSGTIELNDPVSGDDCTVENVREITDEEWNLLYKKL